MPASIEQQWKPEEDQMLRDFIKDGRSIKDVAHHFLPRTARGVYCRVYSLGLKSGTPRTFHSKNEQFWSVPNALNSYYAGLLAADGSVSNESHTLQWVCEYTDRDAMQRFIDETAFTGKIGEYLKKSPRSDYVAIHCRCLVSASQQWNADLSRNFNVIPNKTHRLQPPNLLTDYLKCCYLIGYIDGDGCISYSRSRRAPVIKFVSASVDIMQWIQDFIEPRFPFQIRPKPQQVSHSEGGGYHGYVINGLRAVKVFEFLSQIDVPKYDRKWKEPGFLSIVQEYRDKWPDFFGSDSEVVFDADGNIPTVSAATPLAA